MIESKAWFWFLYFRDPRTQFNMRTIKDIIQNDEAVSKRTRSGIPVTVLQDRRCFFYGFGIFTIYEKLVQYITFTLAYTFLQ